MYSAKRWKLGCVNSPPRTEREPVCGITQPSLHLLAEYCKCTPVCTTSGIFLVQMSCESCPSPPRALPPLPGLIQFQGSPEILVFFELKEEGRLFSGLLRPQRPVARGNLTWLTVVRAPVCCWKMRISRFVRAPKNITVETGERIPVS